MRDLDHIVVQHAVDELVSNVVDHAYAVGAGPGRARPSTPGSSETGDLEVRFADHGRWAAARGRRRAEDGG